MNEGRCHARSSMSSMRARTASSTQSAVRRTVRPSGASAAASTSVRSMRRHRDAAPPRAPRAQFHAPRCRPAPTPGSPAPPSDRTRRRRGRRAPAPAAAGELERLGHDVLDRAAAQLVPQHDSDAEIGGAPRRTRASWRAARCRAAHRGARQPGLDQLAHRRPVRDPVAQVVVGVHRDEAGRPAAERDRHRGRVVSADRDQQLGLDSGDPGGRVHGIRVGGVAGVDDPQTRGVERVAPQSLAHRRRGQVRLVGDSDRVWVGMPATATSARSPATAAGQSPARGQSGSCGSATGSRPNPRAWARVRRADPRPRSPRRIRRPRAGSRPCRGRCAARGRSSRRRAASRRRP